MVRARMGEEKLRMGAEKLRIGMRSYAGEP
jgi:hypothetical protein